jgi:GNAT superfamily N-acetyltransferase
MVSTYEEAVALPGLAHHRADDGDWMALVSLRFGAERRLRELGIQQWNDTARGLERLWDYLWRDEVYVVRDGPSAVGCFSMTNTAERGFWVGDPEIAQFLYLHTVIATPYRGIGAYIVAQALDEARARQLAGVRLDFWKGNDELRAVWERHGFTYLRTVDVPGRDSGALMERRLMTG